MTCAESRNDDYDTEDVTTHTTATKRSLGSADESRAGSRSTKTKQLAPVAARPARPRSVTFRPASDEIKGVVITNAMVSRRQQEDHQQTNVRYGIGAVNERALGKVNNSHTR